MICLVGLVVRRCDALDVHGCRNDLGSASHAVVFGQDRVDFVAELESHCLWGPAAFWGVSLDLHSEGEDFIGPPLRVPSLQTANDFLRQSHGRSKDITDTHNASDRPWNRPTKADVSKDWWFDLGGQYWDSPGGHFP